MSLRDRLEARPRRRVTVPVLVENQDEAQARLAAARTALLAAQTVPDADTIDEQAEVDAAQAALVDTIVAVEFQALPPGEFEAAFSLHQGEDGVDSRALCVTLAAACAVDESLRDEAWWAAQLADDGVWTPGERDGLYHQLLNVLHLWVPSAAVPKG